MPVYNVRVRKTTDRQTGRWVNITGKETYRQAQAESQTDRKTDRKTADREKDRLKDSRQTNGYRHIRIDRHIIDRHKYRQT